MSKTWSVKEAVEFLETYRPLHKNQASNFYFYNPPYYQTPDEYLALFDEWIIKTRRTPLNEIKHRLGQFIVAMGYKLMNEEPNLRLTYAHGQKEVEE